MSLYDENEYETEYAYSEDEDLYDEDWELDHCDECGGYGDDYFINDEGELESMCPYCAFYDRGE